MNVKELDDKYSQMMIEMIRKVNDMEKGHIEADDMLLELLKELGFIKIIDTFNSFGKWYA